MGAAGANHTVLLRSDGTAATCGSNSNGKCDVPALEAGLTYTSVAAGAYYTVLLRSDGTAATCGSNDGGQCDVPALEAGLTYTSMAPATFAFLLIAKAFCTNGILVAATDFAGEALAEVRLEDGDIPHDLRTKLMMALRGHTAIGSTLRFILPSGNLLRDISTSEELISQLHA